MALVSAASTTVAIVFITLGVLDQVFLTSAAMAGFVVIIIIVYVVGAVKLAAKLDGNETGIRIVALTRRVAGALSLGTIASGAYTVLGSANHLLPLEMIITNLLQPVAASAPLLLLLRFIRDSFTRQETRIASREARKKKGTKSTASVAPSTDFSESSTHGKSTTTDV